MLVTVMLCIVGTDSVAMLVLYMNLSVCLPKQALSVPLLALNFVIMFIWLLNS